MPSRLLPVCTPSQDMDGVERSAAGCKLSCNRRSPGRSRHHDAVEQRGLDIHIGVWASRRFLGQMKRCLQSATHRPHPGALSGFGCSKHLQSAKQVAHRLPPLGENTVLPCAICPLGSVSVGRGRFSAVLEARAVPACWSWGRSGDNHRARFAKEPVIVARRGPYHRANSPLLDNGPEAGDPQRKPLALGQAILCQSGSGFFSPHP